MKEESQYFNYRFTSQHKTKFGEGVYVIGSFPELGNWNTKQAIKMKYEENYGWSVEVKLPLEIEFQYKYFVGSFQKYQLLSWLGNHNNKFKISKNLALSSDQTNSNLLKIMSFNVRFQTEKDKNQFSWASRKDNCVEVIINQFPDIIGVQEPRQSQRIYLSGKICQYYDYYGKPRDLIADENSGIFIRKDKYHVIEDGYIWINEDKIQGKRGFGASCIRYFTYLLVAPYSKNQSWFLVFNTHLDHEIHRSRLYGIKYMTQAIENMNKKYNNNIKDIFVMGDFNTSDDDQIFKHLTYNNQLLRSMRYALPQKDSDLGATFNGFTKLLKYIDKTMKYFNLNPGATIDHIFFRSENYKPIQFKTIQVQGKIVSDHYPIVGIFESTS